MDVSGRTLKLSAAQSRLLLTIATALARGSELRRSTRRFYLYAPNVAACCRADTPLPQNTATALARLGAIEQHQQTGQDLPHGYDRALAPYRWDLTEAARQHVAAQAQPPALAADSTIRV